MVKLSEVKGARELMWLRRELERRAQKAKARKGGRP